MNGWKKHLGKACGPAIGAGVFVVCLIITPGLPAFLLAAGLAVSWLVLEIASND
jgi:hypothetical protein